MRSAAPTIDSSRLPALPGVYILFAPPQAAQELGIALGAGGALSVGKAEDSIARRIRGAHLVDDQSGRSTLRRSIGALLRERLALAPQPRSSVGGEIRFRNYAFAAGGEERLTEWICSALTVAPYPVDDPASVQREVIATLQPPLNLTGWPNPARQEIRRRRKECADLARERA